MKEFAADPETSVHPQTVIEHFGTWNAAKRAAGLVPRRFATREELLEVLRRLGAELGRIPTARDLDERRGRMPSKSLYWHTFGSLANALREAGFDVAVGEERLERAVAQGAALARRLGRLPKFADWRAARRARRALLTEWQVYRMFEARRGAWATFQFLVRERLLDEGATVAARTEQWRRLDGARERVGCAASAASRLRQNVPLLRGAHRRQRVGLDVREVGPETLAGGRWRRPSATSSVPSRSSRLRSFSRQ